MSNKTTMAFDGEINNDSLFFNILFLPSGSYSSKIVLHSTDNITISPIINISISDTSLSDKEFNTFFSTILPYNSSSYLSLNVSNVVLIDDPKKMIELTNIKYARYEDVYTYSIKSTTDINDTLIVKILDESNNTLFQEDRSISLKMDEGFLLDIHVPVFKNDSERLNRYSISIRTLDEQELKSFVEKDSFTVSFGISVSVSKTKVTDIETGKSQGYHEICIEGGVGEGIFKSKEIGTTTSAYDDYGGPYVSASGDIAVPVGGGSTGSVGILTGDETSIIKKTKGIAIDGGVGIGCAFKGHRDVIPRVYWQDWPPKDRNLFEGTAGHDVEELQKKLKEMGHDPGPIDGIFGPRTEDAVKEFQEDHGLDVDGIVGPNTKEMIDRKSEEGYHKPQLTSDAPVMKSYKSANWYCTNKPVIDYNSPLDDSIKKHDKYVDPFIKDYCGHRAEFLRKLGKLGPITYIIGVVGEVTGLTGSPVTTLGPEVAESSLTSLKAAEEFQRMADDPPDSNYKEVFELEPYENYVPLVNNSLTNAFFDLSNRLGNHTNILKALRVSIERYQGAFEADSVYYQEIQINATRKYLNLSIKSNEEIINAIDNLYAEIVNKGLENYSRDDFIAFQERISSDGFNETELHRLIDLGLDSSGIEEFRQSVLEINAIGLNDNIFITFVDTKNLIDEANEYEIVWLNKSYPFSNIVKALLKINFRLPWCIDTYRPHDVYVLVNGYQVGELLNTIPNGQYVFEVDPYYLNYADYGVAKNTITLKTLHLNGGHYVVSEDMELIFYLSHIEMPVCAANQSEADDIVLRKSNVIMNATDLATYSRDIMFSNEAPMESELIGINTSIINLGVTSIRNLPVQFFDGEPAEGVHIGEQLIDSILPFQEKLITITWNTTGGDHDIYVVVDPNNEIEETDEYNNKAFKTIFVQEAPDTEKPVIVSATASPDTIEANGADTTLLNVTATDNVGVTSVTVDLSAIGYGIREMTNNSGIWQYTATATLGTSPGTYYLQVKASDAAGNYNDSVSIKLNVTKDTTPSTITNVTATNITSNSAIITWDTDEPSDSLVKYGVESGNYTAQEDDTANATSHSIDLISLAANTTYYYVVNSTDRSGNTNESTEYNFTTTALDTTPPVISNVTATSITSNSAIITWNTDEISNSLVKYGVKSGNYTLTGYNATGVTSHIADLTGLNASTTYYYVVNSTDQSNNSNQSIEHTFTTLTADMTPPTITIHSPEPRTYNTTNIIALAVSADEELYSWWYSLNEGRNQTFIPNTTITARIGSNELIVYANDTSGNVGNARVSFVVNTTNWADDFAGWSGIVSYKNITVSGGDVRIRNATKGSIASIAITPSSMTDWSEFYVNDTVTASSQGTNVTYKILNASDNSTVCAMSSAEANAGYDISSCASGVDSIRLYADLTTADASYTPVLHDWNVSWIEYVTAPTITILSPVNGTTYITNSVDSNYTVNEPTAWEGYSFDSGENVTLYGNTTLTDLAEGTHTLTVYATDTSGNMNSSTVYFSIVKPGGGVTVAVSPKVTHVTNGSTARLNIEIVSTENFDDIFHVYLSVDGIPPESHANLTWFNWTSTEVEVSAKGEAAIPLRADIPTDVSGTKAFNVMAESTKWTPKTFDTGIFEITSEAEKPDLVISDKWLNRHENCTICYNVTNIGTGTAKRCHNTSLYVDGIEVAHDPAVDLAPGDSYTGCFYGYTWTYTPPEDNITVCADSINTINERNETNNCLTDIWMCGDMNCNEAVDMSDVIDLLYYVGYPDKYTICNEWAADVNCDRAIDMSDVIDLLYYVGYPEGYELKCGCM
jgi:peptidoglycan hydrolase-like protein with peptidoglycan-binding domain